MQGTETVMNIEKEHAEMVTGLLAAIASIRGRKQLPNEERLCCMLQKSYGVAKVEAMQHLNQCVSDGVVDVIMAGNGKIDE